MKIKALYEKYDIMPQLALHQLRVGGIAKIITDGWEDKLIARDSVLACLVHDMGNLVKFENLPDPKWRKIQTNYRQKYGGNDAHTATHTILREAGLAQFAVYIEEEKHLYESTPTQFDDFAQYSKPAIMVLYADLRVSPKGVVTIQERTADLIERYKDKRTELTYGPPTEKYVQSLTTINIAEISERDVQPLFPELLEYEL